jgi:sensor c-di-GMP phosphodiesterase-like protein
MGIRISLDDFGTGYSSLSRLARLPIDVLKIDRSFAIPDDARTAVVVGGITRLALDLGLEVVVEGIETAAQRDRFSYLGGLLGQGWLFGRAIRDWEITRLLAHGNEPLGPASRLNVPHLTALGHDQAARAA